MADGKNVVPGDESPGKKAKSSTNKGKGPAKEKTGRQQAGDEVPKKATNANVTNASQNDLIISFMKNIETTMKKQNDRLNKVCEKMQKMDEGYNEVYDEYDDYEYDESCPLMIEGTEDDSADTAASRKRSADEDGSSRFASMAKKFKTQEVCADNIDSALAENVTEFFLNGIDEDRYVELVKDEQTPRPENCEGLVTVKTNQLIWDALGSNARTNDRKLQNIETTVIKAATVLVKSVNKMADFEQAHDKYRELIDECTDVLALLGHANKQINWTRRDLLKPEIKDEYSHLCNHNRPFTRELFGDDVSKSAREIEDCAKISSKINRNLRGRGRTPYRLPRSSYRARGRGMMRGRGSYHPYGTYHYSAVPSESTSEQASKNYQRRGSSRAQRGH